MTRNRCKRLTLIRMMDDSTGPGQRGKLDRSEPQAGRGRGGRAWQQTRRWLQFWPSRRKTTGGRARRNSRGARRPEHRADRADGGGQDRARPEACRPPRPPLRRRRQRDRGRRRRHDQRDLCRARRVLFPPGRAQGDRPAAARGATGAFDRRRGLYERRDARQHQGTRRFGLAQGGIARADEARRRDATTGRCLPGSTPRPSCAS